ncbi:MAG TPA: ATP-binding cassette domain-containing protein, partial [Spirochaetales bacterium]|nr:ATP-binding cassette domain-containing protein [Spirochaetales bacterium]
THIEERGVNLSGGQKQRLAIARAIIARPGILILDDATSAVDVETETRMHDSLSAYLRGGTVFMVAQRVSTVLNADSIVVLDGGRVASVGTHAELLASGGIYREIFDSQLGGGLNGQA